MKDTETVTLDSIFDDYKKHAGWAQLISSNPDDTRTEETLKAAIIKLFEQAIESAKPALKEKTASTEFTTWDRKTKIVKTWESEKDPGFNEGVNLFEQNLLQALSTSGKEEL